MQSKRATAICFPSGLIDTARTSSVIFKVLTFVTVSCLESCNKVSNTQKFNKLFSRGIVNLLSSFQKLRKLQKQIICTQLDHWN
uniref:Uncharacterized protein n=1 Tax=Arundo donax TaxID=35708 RepID=A0A0A9DCN3_ARUDO